MSSLVDLIWPEKVPMPVGSPGTNTATLDGTADLITFVFQAEEAATITHVAYRQGTLTGTPGTMRVGLQGVSTAGDADGTWLGGTATGYNDYSSWSGANDGLWVVLALSESVSLTQGQLVAVVCDPLSGTWNASNAVTVGTCVTNVQVAMRSGIAWTNGTKVATLGAWFILLRSSSRSYGYGQQSYATQTVGQATTPDEYGIKFTTPNAPGDTFKVRGIRVGANIATGKTFDMTLYDTDGSTVIETVSFDTDQVNGGTMGSTNLRFTSTHTLASNSTYRITLTGTASATNITAAYMDFAAAGDIGCMVGETYHWTERTDDGSWTDTTTKLPLIQVIREQYNVPSAGGGLAANPLGGFVR